MTNATTLPHLRSALRAVLAAARFPVGSAAQRQPRLPASGAHLIPSFQAGGLQWSTRSVGAFGGSVQAELGKGAVLGAVEALFKGD
ncbi:MAG: hypothetical protein FIB01_14950, partial [Gemmatimonadetes bacterium]|nr:hypothetical protein [Gemmatimonadota bacterium]